MLLVGRIGKPHGVRGDLFVSFVSDRAERREVGAVLTARQSTARGTVERELTVETCRPQSDRFVIHFTGCDTRNDAEALVNADLYADAIVDPDALWVHDLIGSTVVTTTGDVVGTCVAVIDNPAHALIEVDSGVLVPVPFVVEQTDGRVVIDPPPGLLTIGDDDDKNDDRD